MLKHILVVEDEPDIAELVRLHLEELEARVSLCAHGREALEWIEREPFDLVVLDLGLPGLDGLEVCRRLRQREVYVPVLILTARSGEGDRILGLEMGADDYLPKPFNVMELAARVKALFRRVEALRNSFSAPLTPNIKKTFGALTLDPLRREVCWQCKAIDLTAKEFDLLAHCAEHPGRVFSREQLLQAVWGTSHRGYEHTVNSHINRLRAKIEPDPANPVFILTIWGVGYKFVETG
jgi:two-component system OmpR family response regulator